MARSHWLVFTSIRLADTRFDRGVRSLALHGLATVALIGCTPGPTAPATDTTGPETTGRPADSVGQPPKPRRRSSGAPAPSARAVGYQVRAHPTAGVAFELASTWQLSGAAETTLLAGSPDGQAVLMFVVADPDTLDDAMAAIRRGLESDVQDVYFGPATNKTVGSMTAELATGAGKLEGRPVELGQLLIATPTGKVFIVLAVIEAAAPALSKQQARHTLESIRPKP